MMIAQLHVMSIANQRPGTEEQTTGRMLASVARHLVDAFSNVLTAAEMTCVKVSSTSYAILTFSVVHKLIA